MPQPQQKKDAGDASKSAGISNTDMIGSLLAIIILFVIVQRIYIRLRMSFIDGGGVETTGGLITTFTDGIWVVKVLAVIIIAVSLAGIVHTRGRFMRLGKIEKDFYYPAGTSVTEDIKNLVVHNRWATVMKHADSDNPNDWKVAILEADIILDELLDKIGYQGDSIGDKLKQAQQSSFITLDQAWEAHKIRNAIAHEGSEFLINQREVLRVLGLYKAVFDEFYYI